MGGFTGCGRVPMHTTYGHRRRHRACTAVAGRGPALLRAPQAEDACWADVHMPDGTVRACGRPEATSLGLCAEHRVELFGLEAS